jgi:hypothetical protein
MKVERLYGLISQKIELIIAAAVRTSTPSLGKESKLL